MQASNDMYRVYAQTYAKARSGMELSSGDIYATDSEEEALAEAIAVSDAKGGNMGAAIRTKSQFQAELQRLRTS